MPGVGVRGVREHPRMVFPCVPATEGIRRNGSRWAVAPRRSRGRGLAGDFARRRGRSGREKSGRGGELGPEAGPPKPRGGPVRSVRGQYRAEARRAEDSDATFSSLAAPSCHQTVHLRKWAERAMLHLAPRGRVPFLPKRDARHLHRLNPHPPLHRFRLSKPTTSIAPTPSRIDFPSTIVSSSLPAIHSSRTPRPRRRGSPTRQRRTWYRLCVVFEMHVLSVHLEMHPSLVDRVPLWATRRHQGGHLGSIVCFDYLIGRIFT